MIARFATILSLVGAAGAIALPISVSAQSGATCQHCGGQCEHCQLVPCQIMVPALVVETHMKTCVIKEEVEREVKYTVFQKIPTTRKIYKEKCHMECDVVTKTITQKKCHLVPCEVVKSSTKTTYQPVVRDVNIKNCDGTCETRPCQVMVPVKEPCISTRNELHVAMETITKDIDYCVKVPKIEKVLCGVEQGCEIKPIERTKTVTVCVPKLIKMPQEVLVRKMIPKTVYCCPKCAKHHR